KLPKFLLNLGMFEFVMKFRVMFLAISIVPRIDKSPVISIVEPLSTSSILSSRYCDVMKTSAETEFMELQNKIANKQNSEKANNMTNFVDFCISYLYHT
ncbi:MAG: hypothetical protein J5779_00750, partial [Clostridia bacterium]|nr:hypothetical protein [Clostridia bacterium]